MGRLSRVKIAHYFTWCWSLEQAVGEGGSESFIGGHRDLVDVGAVRRRIGRDRLEQRLNISSIAQ